MAAQAVPKFVHRISAKEAVQLLLTKGFDGSFLVRTSTNDPDVYALSYRQLNKIAHIKFETTEKGYKAVNLPDEYPTIAALITEAQKMTTGLDYPLWPSDPAPVGLLPRLFFGRLVTKHAEKLLLDPDAQADRNFLIRNSTSHTDQLVLSVRLPTGKVIHVLTHRRGDRIIMKGEEDELEFNDIKELIDFYMKPDPHDIQHADGTVIKLKKPMICPWNKDSSNELYVNTEFESEEGPARPQKAEVGRRMGNIQEKTYQNISHKD